MTRIFDLFRRRSPELSMLGVIALILGIEAI